MTHKLIKEEMDESDETQLPNECRTDRCQLCHQQCLCRDVEIRSRRSQRLGARCLCARV
ncbi:hypothetical protein VDIAB_100255 [Vibrio diabolicus]|nr:hypothetical protein VDIAB_100255 [Vibrio diabolicus]